MHLDVADQDSDPASGLEPRSKGPLIDQPSLHSRSREISDLNDGHSSSLREIGGHE